MTEPFDGIVLGAGEAGTIVASLAIEAGRRVALVYRAPFGSTCLNTGCVPSKFLIHRARVAHVVRTAGRFHVHAAPPRVDLRAIVQDKDRTVAEHREESFRAAQATETLTLVEGAARFRSGREVEVGGHRLTAPTIVIATGMRPLVPALAGLDQVPFLTNETLMELAEPPEQLLVVGGGYIACELGQAYFRFGSKVTMFQSHEHLLPREEPDVSTALERAFLAEGLALVLGHRVQRVERAGTGVRVFARSRSGDVRVVEGTHLLVAAGRQPNTDELELAAAGVATDDHGFIRVDDRLQTTVSGIWAAGDVNGQQPFTRICQEEGKVAYANAFEGQALEIDRLALPHAIFTDPEIGSVGLTEDAARAAGHDVAAGLVTFDRVEKAEIIGETAGFIKYVTDRRTHRLLGCHVVGPAAADLVYDAVIVMRHRGTLDELALAVGVFPTLQEGMEGTARGLLRIAPEETAGPLVTARILH